MFHTNFYFLMNYLSSWLFLSNDTFQKRNRLLRQLKKDWLIRTSQRRENVKMFYARELLLLLISKIRYMCGNGKKCRRERMNAEWLKHKKCLCREKEHVLPMQEMARSGKFTWWWVTCVNMKRLLYIALIYVSSTSTTTLIYIKLYHTVYEFFYKFFFE